MQPERLAELIKSPWNLSREDYSELEKIIREYPYFTTARLLYLYASRLFDRVTYEKHLPDIPSLNISHFIISHWLNLPKSHTKPEAEQKKTQTTDMDDSSRISEPNEKSTISPDKLPDEKEINKHTEKNQTSSSVESLDSIILPDVYKSMEEAEINVMLENPSGLEDRIPEKSNDSPSQTVQKNNSFGREEEEKKKNFIEWLATYCPQANQKKDGTGVELSMDAGNVADEKSKDKKKDEKQKKQRELLDKIIEKNPGPIKSKPGERGIIYQSEKAARESLLDSEDFVTETLAGLYVQQGHIAKAIRVYEILSLKFPKKSTYFAEKISELKKQQKNKTL